VGLRFPQFLIMFDFASLSSITIKTSIEILEM